jgi:hypothetical protein
MQQSWSPTTQAAAGAAGLGLAFRTAWRRAQRLTYGPCPMPRATREGPTSPSAH